MEVLLSFPGSKISPMIQAQIGHFGPDTAGTKRIPIGPTAESASHHFFQESPLKELRCASESPPGSSRLQNRGEGTLSVRTLAL